MSEELVVAVIVDTTSPAAASRLLHDLGRLARLDNGFSNIEIVVLENPSSEPEPLEDVSLSAEGLRIHRVTRQSQERDVGRGHFGHLNLDRRRLPIATARTLVQRYAFERARPSGASVWILDEDMRLSPLLDGMVRGEPMLSERVRDLRESHVDVAIGTVLGAPPLPARSTARVNLEDLWRHLEVMAALSPEAPWPDCSAENARVRQSLPEYYYDLTRAHEDPGARPMWLERLNPNETAGSVFARLAEGVGGLLDGIPLTRSLPERPLNPSRTSTLARGGNTFVLRASLLDAIPNVAPRLGGRICRRSDMLWARLCVTLEGARFADAPLTTLQDRHGPGRSSFEADKLVDDIRGSALVGVLDDLIARGAAPGRRALPRSNMTRAREIYVARARERLEAVHRSENRARLLLDRVTTMLNDPSDRPGFLRHPGYKSAIEQLLENASGLCKAYGQSTISFDPFDEQDDVERFLLGLDKEIAAFAVRSTGAFGQAINPVDGDPTPASTA